jgi:hypothetical protein
VVTNDVTIWRMFVACWVSMATSTHAYAQAHAPGHLRTRICNTYYSSSVTMIRERASVLRYIYIACVVFIIIAVVVDWSTL